ncbi:MAG: hypothetical protein WHV66_14635 [Anaerolineales bacterium]
MEMDPRFGVDRLASALLEFPQGTASFIVSTQLFPYQRVQIMGTKGRIEIEIPFNPPTNQPCRIYMMNEGRKEVVVVPVCNHYTLQGDAFSLAIIEDKAVPTPLEDALANMKAIDWVKAAATG